MNFLILLAAAVLAGPTPPLTAEIAALDTKVFAAYNRCDLDTFGRYFDPNVAFFHDTGGATFDRATVLANTKKYICGKVRRELIPASLRIYPVKDYGAIEEGEHRFLQAGDWPVRGRYQVRDRITNVLSYGHRALTEAERNETQK